MSGLTFKLFGQELRIHDLERVGVAAVPTEDGHDVGAHVSLNLQATDTSGPSFGVGASCYMSANAKLCGGSANVGGPIFIGAWGGGEVDVLRNLDSGKTQVGVSAGAFGVLPLGFMDLPIYVKGGFLDVTDLKAWSVTAGLAFSFEFLRDE